MLHTIGLGFHEKPYVMIPLIGCLVVVAVLVVALVLFCKRRQDKLSYKGKLQCMKNDAVNPPPPPHMAMPLMLPLLCTLSFCRHDAWMPPWWVNRQCCIHASCWPYRIDTLPKGLAWRTNAMYRWVTNWCCVGASWRQMNMKPWGIMPSLKALHFA